MAAMVDGQQLTWLHGQNMAAALPLLPFRSQRSQKKGGSNSVLRSFVDQYKPTNRQWPTDEIFRVLFTKLNMPQLFNKR